MAGPARVYAIGDVHGELAQLKAVHEAIAADLAENPAISHTIVHVGDYIDRGPDSAGVLQYLSGGVDADEPWVTLLGNHDRMFLRYLAAPGGRDERLSEEFWWLHDQLGGVETLRSYGLTVPDGLSEARGAALHREAREKVPALHFAFLAGLRRYWVWRGWLFVHAGVKPGVALTDQDEDDLIWIRQEFLTSDADHGEVVIHGHTPVEAVEDHGNRIAIDTGACFGGPLSCLAVDDQGGARVLGGAVLREPAGRG